MILSKMLVAQNASVEAIVCAKSGQRMKAADMTCILYDATPTCCPVGAAIGELRKKTAVVLQRKLVVRIIVYRRCSMAPWLRHD